MITWQESYQILNETLRGWVETALRHLPNAVVAILVIALFWVLSIIFKRLFEKVFRKNFDSDVILRLSSVLIKVLVIFLGVFIALGALGLQKAVLSMLAGAGIIGIALGFAFQDTAENFIAGVVMGIRKPFRKGDLIETHDRMGYVLKLNLRNTILENFDGQQVIIPNKEVFQNTLINFQTTGKRRVDFEVGVAYDTDLAEALKVAKDAVEKALDFIIDHEAQTLAYEFGDSSINLKIRYWIKVPGDTDYYTARHLGVQAIHKAFNDSGIVIPFPIRTLEFGESSKRFFGDVGKKDGSAQEHSDISPEDEKPEGPSADGGDAA